MERTGKMVENQIEAYISYIEKDMIAKEIKPYLSLQSLCRPGASLHYVLLPCFRGAPCFNISAPGNLACKPVSHHSWSSGAWKTMQLWSLPGLSWFEVLLISLMLNHYMMDLSTCYLEKCCESRH